MANEKILIINKINILNLWDSPLLAKGYSIYLLGPSANPKDTIENKEPALVILDLSTSAIGEEERFRILQDISRLRRRPSVILVTSTRCKRKEVKKKLDEMGCGDLVDEIVIKAVYDDSLVSMVKKVLERANKHAKAQKGMAVFKDIGQIDAIIYAR